MAPTPSAEVRSWGPFLRTPSRTSGSRLVSRNSKRSQRRAGRGLLPPAALSGTGPLYGRRAAVAGPLADTHPLGRDRTGGTPSTAPLPSASASAGRPSPCSPDARDSLCVRYSQRGEVSVRIRRSQRSGARVLLAGLGLLLAAALPALAQGAPMQIVSYAPQDNAVVQTPVPTFSFEVSGYDQNQTIFIYFSANFQVDGRGILKPGYFVIGATPDSPTSTV